MEGRTFYGIEYKYKSIPEQEFSHLARLLFLSNSLRVELVIKLVNKLPDLSKEEIKELTRVLDHEVSLLKSSSRFIPEFDLLLLPRLQDWIDFFGCEPKEINEYIDYFGISVSFEKRSKLTFKKSALTPKKIQARLNDFIIGQEHAKKILSSAVYMHLLRNGEVRPAISRVYSDGKPASTVPVLPNPNIVLIGSTGTGKSYILKTIAMLFDIPLLKIDCASLTASGYVGSHLNDFLFTFFSPFGYNPMETNKTIIFFDEFDKLSEYTAKRSEGSVGGVEVQQEFLQLLEDKEFLLHPTKNSKDDPVTIKFNDCMFVFGGSFSGIENIVRKRTGLGPSLGFKKSEINETRDILSYVTPPDLVAFGIIPELVGRINHIVTLEDHTKDTILNILKKSKDSTLIQYENYFNAHYDRLIIKEEVYELIAEKILESKTGARAINSILNELLKDFLYESPNLEMEDIVVDKEHFLRIFPNHNKIN